MGTGDHGDVALLPCGTLDEPRRPLAGSACCVRDLVLVYWRISHQGSVESARYRAQLDGERDRLDEKRSPIREAREQKAKLLFGEVVVDVAVCVLDHLDTRTATHRQI